MEGSKIVKMLQASLSFFSALESTQKIPRGQKMAHLLFESLFVQAISRQLKNKIKLEFYKVHKSFTFVFRTDSGFS